MRRNSFTLKDSTQLSYLEGGEGTPLLMLHGWSQSAEGFSGQFDALCRIRRVIALDFRGHGESNKPQSGYRICRFAKDVLECLESLGISEFDILTHSLGTSVTWAYLEMFGKDRPPRDLIFFDEPASLLARPDWDENTRLDAGAIIPSLEALSEFTANIRGADTVAAHAEIMRPMFTSGFPEQKLLNLAADNLKLPRNHAATLIEDNCLQDWRSTIKTVRNRALVIAAEASPHPLQSQQWIASQIPGSKLEIIPEKEGGSHFAFAENPQRFSDPVLEFLNG